MPGSGGYHSSANSGPAIGTWIINLGRIYNGPLDGCPARHQHAPVLQGNRSMICARLKHRNAGHKRSIGAKEIRASVTRRYRPFHP